nr:CRISPR-associated endonuclease Cas1 [Caldichromatium japonicum]
MHAVRPGRAALALDLIEKFRAVLVDRLALTLINRAQIKEDDFELREGGSVMLKDSGRRKVLVAWQNRKQEELTNPLTGNKLPLCLLPFIQARFMARTVHGEMACYLPYLTK